MNLHDKHPCQGAAGASHPLTPPARETALAAGLVDAKNVQLRVDQMTLAEQIGQKIMIDARYFNDNEDAKCFPDMTKLPASLKAAISRLHLGGFILFSNNLVSTSQIQALTRELAELGSGNGYRLFIATDNEGGNVFRLPRGEYRAFPGNMALGAIADEATAKRLAFAQGQCMGEDLLSLGINTNFAPVADVNSNQSNPVINVRSYGDSPEQVGILAKQTASGLANAGVIASLKHFPGHGDTHIDSHFGLPQVTRSREEAEAIDLLPFRKAIAQSTGSRQIPMIMTAHIQYAALDDTKITNSQGKHVVVPATMSRKIQTDLLRHEMGFDGVTITDALDMKAISNNFTNEQVIEYVFNAGVDIALMPINIYSQSDIERLESLIDLVIKRVESGAIDRKEITESARRIIELKLRYNLTAESLAASEASTIAAASTEFAQSISSTHAACVTANVNGLQMSAASRLDNAKAIEIDIARQSITLLKNADSIIPLYDKKQKIFIAMPWQEQGEAMKSTFKAEGFLAIDSVKIGELSWQDLCKHLDDCDVLIVGSMSTAVSPVEKDGVVKEFPPEVSLNPPGDPTSSDYLLHVMRYAKRQHKKLIHITLRAPYDIIRYDDIADGILATYSYYGVENGIRKGVSLNAVAEIITGKTAATGILPVNIHNLDSQGNPTELKYPRGFRTDSRKINA